MAESKPKPAAKRGTYEKNLNAAAICSILKECARAKVRHFRLGDLEIKFGEDALALPKEEAPLQQFETLELREHEAVKDTTKQLAADEIEQLMVNDPVEYEKIILAELGNLSDEEPIGEETPEHS